MIDRYPGSNQHPDGLDMRVFTRGNQSRTAVTVHAVDIRAMAERQRQNLVQSLGSGIQEGRILHGVLRIHVSSGKNQRRSRSDGVVLGGLDEWSPFALAARFDVRAGSQGSGNSCGIIAVHSIEERAFGFRRRWWIYTRRRYSCRCCR